MKLMMQIDDTQMKNEKLIDQSKLKKTETNL